MELALRLLFVVVVLVVLFGVPLYFCFKGMARQARLGHVDRLRSGKTLTGLGLTLFVSIVPIMVFRQAWLFAFGFALLSGAMILIGRRAGESLVGNHRR